MNYKANILYFAGRNLKTLAKKYGTPIYIYDLDGIANVIDDFKKALGPTCEIHYASKANAHPAILKLMKQKGVGIDAVSKGEIKAALDVGISAKDIIFSGVAKTVSELQFAISKNIKSINVESVGELKRIARLAQEKKKFVDVAIRFNPDVDAKTHPYITTGFRENKFGMDKSFIPEIKSILKKSRFMRLKGMTIHIGSQLTDLKPFRDAIRKTLPYYKAFQSEGFPLEFFNVGGGLGISYQSETIPSLQSYGAMIQRELKGLGAKILCEPGRILVGGSGVLLTEVQYMKSAPSKNFLIVDTGMHHLLRPSLYGAYHDILPVVRRSGQVKTYDVVGPICESSDFLGRDREFKGVKERDLLAILDVGAYGYSMASTYNAHALPREICLKGKKVLSKI